MKNTIEYSDFDKLDFRVGKIISASSPDWSEKLLEFKVDFGPEIGEKMILSGVKKWYIPSDFEGKLFPFIVNLAERKMGEGVSQGMMLMVDDQDQPRPIQIDQGLTVGSVLR